MSYEYSHLKFGGVKNHAALALYLQSQYEDLSDYIRKTPGIVQIHSNSDNAYGDWYFSLSNVDQLDYVIDTLLGLPHVNPKELEPPKPVFIIEDEYEKVMNVLKEHNVPLETILDIEHYITKGKQLFDMIPKMRKEVTNIKQDMKQQAKEEILKGLMK